MKSFFNLLLFDVELKFLLGAHQLPNLWLCVLYLIHAKNFAKQINNPRPSWPGGLDRCRRACKLQTWRHQKSLQSCSLAYLSFVAYLSWAQSDFFQCGWCCFPGTKIKYLWGKALELSLSSICASICANGVFTSLSTERTCPHTILSLYEIK